MNEGAAITRLSGEDFRVDLSERRGLPPDARTIGLDARRAFGTAAEAAA